MAADLDTVLVSFQVLAAGVLAATLAASGSVKIHRPFPSALAMVRFGLVRRIRARNGRVAGVVEVATGLAFAAGWTRLGFASAAALGLLFTAIVGRALVHDERFECACFGGRGGRLSMFTLARAAGLVTLACGGLAMATINSPRVDGNEHVLGLAAGVLVVSAASLGFALARERPFRSRMRPLEEAA